MKMEDKPSEKQISYAQSLGIENPSTYSRQTLRELIDKKLNGANSTLKDTPKPQAPPVVKATMAASPTANVLNITDKPHSYEMGKAGQRHKIYYNSVEELVAHVDALKEAGLIEEFETIRPGELNAQ